MKRTLFSFLLVSLLLPALTHAQLFKKVLGGDTTKGSTVKTQTRDLLNGVLSAGKKGSTGESEVVAGLKEALTIGAQNSGKMLSSLDGYFGNAAIKVLMPPEARNVEQQLRSFGLGKQVDQAILSMNRAAEDAAKSAAPIFADAIKKMTIQDAMGILKGGDFAATKYLQDNTTKALTEAFRPVVENSLKKVDATKYWNTVFTTYNQFSKEKVNPDLNAYVTERAITGIFHQVGLEEQKIRKDPVARTTELLKKVFGQQ
jgi:hypothetical protein